MYIMSMKDASDREPVHNAQAQKEHRAHAERVLIVEDQALLRFLAVDMLETEGYPTVAAANAQEALEALGNFSDIGFIFSDINMPGSVDGLELARTVDARWPNVGIILTSGEDLGRAPALPHGTVFLPKPYEWDEVYRSLEKVQH
ncbi:response regulator [Gluconobacter morbifer]|uniref:Response regulatory domain-containing protein n=1 Tax=Gluconobacter morbifer G707 TaxID=1088869 RepID=G6XGN8_9PROT|nr:response regulator [Gluconobacter morbifer]EHH69346.1 hypothetical protein GMO_06530 [Gluconobacter morbifer G707]